MLSACVSLRCAGVGAVSVLRLCLQVPVPLYSDPLLLEWRGTVLTHKKTANYSGPAVSQVGAGSRRGAPTFSNSHLHAWNCIKTSVNAHQSQPPSHQFFLAAPQHIIPRLNKWKSSDGTWLTHKQPWSTICWRNCAQSGFRFDSAHASAFAPGADMGKLRQQTLIYILMDTEEYLLIFKASAHNYRVYTQLSELPVTSFIS